MQGVVVGQEGARAGKVISRSVTRRNRSAEEMIDGDG